MHTNLITRQVAYYTLLMAIGLGIISGCSSRTSTPLKLVQVKGKVSLDGTPLAGANVVFIPQRGTKGAGGSGVTDSEGRYEAHHLSNKIGIEPGSYSIVFSKIALPDGSAIPKGKMAADVGAIEVLPTHLSHPDPDVVTNSVTIPANGGTFDFNVASN